MNFLASASAGLWLDKTFASLDMSLFQFFGSIQNSVLTAIAMILTAFGEPRFVILFGVFGLILCFPRRTRKLGLGIVFSVIIGTLLTNVVIKPLVMRIRPYNTLQTVPEYFAWYQGVGMPFESDYCFPSGHATATMEIALVMCFYFASEKKGKVAWIPPLVAVLAGCSRVYLMVHYATDVLAGWLIGIIAAIAGYLIASALTKAINNAADRHAAEKGKRPRGRSVSSVQMTITCLTAGLLIFLISYIPTISNPDVEAERCAYNIDYTCYNEAEFSEKYPPIDGKHYCKIHWKELNQ